MGINKRLPGGKTLGIVRCMGDTAHVDAVEFIQIEMIFRGRHVVEKANNPFTEAPDLVRLSCVGVFIAHCSDRNHTVRGGFRMAHHQTGGGIGVRCVHSDSLGRAL